VSGSGKSTLAKTILTVEENSEGIIFSTDDYFMQPDPITNELTYQFDISKLSDAHEWNQQRCEQAMKAWLTNPEPDSQYADQQIQRHRVIIIDNTNVQKWEAKPYIQLCLNYQFATMENIYIREPDTPWWKDQNLEEMAKRNTHEVSAEIIGRMLERWEVFESIQAILDSQKPERLNNSGSGSGSHRGNRGGYGGNRPYSGGRGRGGYYQGGNGYGGQGYNQSQGYGDRNNYNNGANGNGSYNSYSSGHNNNYNNHGSSGYQGQSYNKGIQQQQGGNYNQNERSFYQGHQSFQNQFHSSYSNHPQ
jgi:predicted kinase